MSNGCKITDERIIEAILSTNSQVEASKVLGITPQTLCNRLHKPKLKAKLNEYRRDVLDRTSNQLVKSNLKATETLTQLLDSESDITKYNAASRILQLSKDYISLSDIAERLDRLENDINRK